MLVCRCVDGGRPKGLCYVCMYGREGRDRQRRVGIVKESKRGRVPAETDEADAVMWDLGRERRAAGRRMLEESVLCAESQSSDGYNILYRSRSSPR